MECGHRCVCVPCADRLWNQHVGHLRKCPICRSSMSGVMRIVRHQGETAFVEPVHYVFDPGTSTAQPRVGARGVAPSRDGAPAHAAHSVMILEYTDRGWNWRSSTTRPPHMSTAVAAENQVPGTDLGLPASSSAVEWRRPPSSGDYIVGQVVTSSAGHDSAALDVEAGAQRSYAAAQARPSAPGRHVRIVAFYAQAARRLRHLTYRWCPASVCRQTISQHANVQRALRGVVGAQLVDQPLEPHAAVGATASRQTRRLASVAK
mmetsp:Transcript_42249/g.112977  ORF Transcript_42249/g.112977 Transcript_42249/m.112977 type:complete len:262 (+) Transcript_42249:444-1229(+)